MKTYIQEATLVNEGRCYRGSVLIADGKIAQISTNPIPVNAQEPHRVIEAQGLYLLPGAIDDQVHFREPGLTHKGEIYTEAKAAVAGGITSYMEMPNVQPPTLTQALLEEKYARAAEKSLANYSFYMGTSNENIDEVLKTDPRTVCGLKIFMGSSTGNMLVDKREVLETIFSKFGKIIALHCEDEATIRANTARAREQFGEDVPMTQHPIIRDEEACYRSSSLAVELAQKHGARIHVLHISTGKETQLFRNDIPLANKKITSEACIHHLWFTQNDYPEKGAFIKWNPAVKSEADRAQIWEALLDDRIDVIATDHAPHTLAEKSNPYFSCPSGGPLVQHALPAMLEFVKQGKISIEKVVEKMAHNVAILFGVEQRGFIREGYFADLVLVKPDAPWQVTRDSVLYKCGWSPFEGQIFHHQITHTFVNGHLAYANGVFDESQKGQRLLFNR